MQGGAASLSMVAHDIAPMLLGQDPLDHAVLLDRALHKLVKLGLEGALTGALAVGDTMPLALDANDGYTTGGAIRVSRALEERGYWWFDQTRPMIGHMANLHVVASLLHGVKPVEWDDPSTRTMRYSTIRPCRWTDRFTCQPPSAWSDSE